LQNLMQVITQSHQHAINTSIGDTEERARTL
jgi:hypothetical protein